MYVYAWQVRLRGFDFAADIAADFRKFQRVRAHITGGLLTSLATSDVSTHSLLSLHFLVFPFFPSRPFLPLDVALFKIQLRMDFGSTVNSTNGSGYTARLPKRICYFVHFFEPFCEIYKEMEKAWASRLVLNVIGL